MVFDKYVEEEQVSQQALEEELLRAMILCNDATNSAGDPTEIALISFLDEGLVEERKLPYMIFSSRTITDR